MGEGIVLDRKSFEALAVETRVKLLKSLRERRKTLTELAEERGMSVSGIKEHLAVLEKAELVRKMDDGHKWKYYELTGKGGEVVAPKELKVWLLLSISAVALLGSALAILGALQPAAEPAHAPELRAFAAGAQPAGGADEAKAAEPPGPQPRGAAGPDLAVPLAVGGISAATLAGCIAVLWRNRMRAA